MQRIRLVVLACFLLFAGAREHLAGAKEATCVLPPGEATWVQTAVEGWERASREFLKVDPHPFPWTVMLGRSCVWHIGADARILSDARPTAVHLRMSGGGLRVHAKPHDGLVSLPSGKELSVSAVAFGSVFNGPDGKSAPFFVMALPHVWREDPKAAADSRLDSMMLGVFSHEVIHTRQLADVGQRVSELEKRFTLPEDVTDDIIEQRFRDNPGFATAYEAETSLFYRAASAQDPAERLRLTREALGLVDARHAKYYSGPNSVYAELEGLFLNMEGVAVWTAYRLSKADPRFDIGIEDPAADRARNTWSQDEGLALLLLVDALAPDWRKRMLGAELASPFTILREAVNATEGNGECDGDLATDSRRFAGGTNGNLPARRATQVDPVIARRGE